MQWLGLILGVALGAAAVFYFIIGFVPGSAISNSMRARLELAAEARTAKGNRINTASFYAWLFRTRPRAAIVVIFLAFWAIWFFVAGLRS